jgi:transposase
MSGHSPSKTAVIPSRANRQVGRIYDRHLFSGRHLIENLFARLKQFRAIATRYDKTRGAGASAARGHGHSGDCGSTSEKTRATACAWWPFCNAL